MKTGTKIPVTAIIGPTAVGKTELSLKIAEELNAEIISVDSRQVYRYMDVGTDKASSETRKRVIHHLIDVVDPDERFTVMDFSRQSLDAVRRIRARGKRVILAGGTPFYYRALLEGAVQEDLPENRGVRKKLEKELLSQGAQALYDRLFELDEKTAEKIHPNDTHRVIRALEIFEVSGKIPSQHYKERKSSVPSFDVLYIGLDRPRGLLYEGIAERVRYQFENGYIEEVQWLLDNGFSPELPAMQGFGYKEIISYLSGDMTYEEAIEGDIRATKAFSRRQMTWFRKFEPVMWYDTSVGDKSVMAEQICKRCLSHYFEEAAP